MTRFHKAPARQSTSRKGAPSRLTTGVFRYHCAAQIREGADGGLVALALAPRASRCGSACKTAGSASKHTPCLLGDMGAQVASEDEDEGGAEDSTKHSAPAARASEPSGTDAPSEEEEEEEEEDSRVASSRIAAMSCSDTTPPSDEELAETLARQVARRDGAWGVGPAPARLAAAAGAAERAWWEFFAEGREEDKRRCVGSGGRGGPTQRLMLWGNGWTSQRCREQFHTVMGALDAQVSERRRRRPKPPPSPKAAASTCARGEWDGCGCERQRQDERDEAVSEVDAREQPSSSPRH